ncbi:MAG: peptidylprolyl isomerase [Planctomycetota bacterium]
MRTAAILAVSAVLTLASSLYAVNPQVVLDVNDFGKIAVELYLKDAPVTVANFLGYVNSDFYDGLIFHRVVQNFVIQAGAYDRDLIYHHPFASIINESYNGLSNLRGTLAMARSLDPDSADSQFYINQNNSTFLDKANAADGFGYCVFGRVVSDLGIIDAIAATPIHNSSTPPSGDIPDMNGVPITPVIIREAFECDSLAPLGVWSGTFQSDTDPAGNGTVAWTLREDLTGEGQWQFAGSDGSILDMTPSGTYYLDCDLQLIATGTATLTIPAVGQLVSDYTLTVTGVIDGNSASGTAGIDFSDPQWPDDTGAWQVNRDTVFQAPDLIVDINSYTPGTYGPGQVITANGFELNIGGSDAAPGFYTDVYLSTDPQINSSDILLQRFTNVGGLSAAQVNNLFTEVFIPIGTPPGSYYLGAIIDDPNNVRESDETNNTWHSATNDIHIDITRLYVDTANGNDLWDGTAPVYIGGSTGPKAAIQTAIDSANNNMTVMVAQGTYTGPGNRDLDFHGKILTVQSWNPVDPNTVAATVIDCQANAIDQHRGFYFHSAEGAGSMVAGFTIKNGYAPFGGGIFCENNSSPSILNCAIKKCRADNSGGAIAGSAGAVTDCVITSNAALSGNGGGFYNCSGLITDCTISANRAEARGGAIYNCDGTITDCNITGNEAGTYGGALADCDGSILNCYIAGSLAVTGYGGALYNCQAIITNCNIIDSIGTGISDCNAVITTCTITGSSQRGLTSCNGPITDSIISGNLGGGLYNCNGAITNCDIINNSAMTPGALGGGLHSCFGAITGCNISGNRAQANGGGLYNCDGPITSCDILDNHCDDPAGQGGGLHACDGDIKDCTIAYNCADEFGGALYWCTGSISNCDIYENRAGFGGGLYGFSGPISSCSITNNYAQNNGGGLNYCDGPITESRINGNRAGVSGGGFYRCHGLMTNCLITGNIAGQDGGAIYDSAADITNCTVADNSAVGNGGGLNQCTGEILNSIIWANTAAASPQMYGCSMPKYSCFPAAGGANENIAVDPCFVQPGSWDANGTAGDTADDFWIAGNYHLKSQAGRPDPVDLDHNNRVDLGDFAFFAELWLKTGPSLRADFNADGRVNALDLLLFLQSYPDGDSLVADDVTSMCIDAGHPGFDWTAEPQPNGHRINMGVYGRTPEASMSINPDPGFPPAVHEDFETGNFAKYPWLHSGNIGWTVAAGEFCDPSYAARSGNIDHDQESVLEVTLAAEYAVNTISFCRKVSCEQDYDFLEFYIDDQLTDQFSGEITWDTVIYWIEPGLHTFKWIYVKDVTGDSGQDSAWIDNVRLYFDPDNQP